MKTEIATQTAAAKSAAHSPLRAGRGSRVVPLPGALTKPLRQRVPQALPKAVLSLWRTKLDRLGALRAMVLREQFNNLDADCAAAFKTWLDLDKAREEATARAETARASFFALESLRDGVKQRLAETAMKGGEA